MIRLGLCCKFDREPINFKVTTARYVSQLTPQKRRAYLSELCAFNAGALSQAIDYCAANGIGGFRINSQILPLKTHPSVGYNLKDLPDGQAVIERFILAGKKAGRNRIRLTFHPDQFILLSSPDRGVTRRSVAELEYQAEVSEWVGADVINIHGGGAYGDKPSALARVAQNIPKLSRRIRCRLTLENDDRVYTPADLLPLCEKRKVPLVYDVHHHRCLTDGLSVEQATQQALGTWNREPLFHISSPREGWDSKMPQYHHDFIRIKDFPECWRGLNITVEVEAKAKERAIKRLLKELA